MAPPSINLSSSLPRSSTTAPSSTGGRARDFTVQPPCADEAEGQVSQHLYGHLMLPQLFGQVGKAIVPEELLQVPAGAAMAAPGTGTSRHVWIPMASVPDLILCSIEPASVQTLLLFNISKDSLHSHCASDEREFHFSPICIFKYSVI